MYCNKHIIFISCLIFYPYITLNTSVDENWIQFIDLVYAECDTKSKKCTFCILAIL